jgi:hypothetical protein
MTTPTVNAEIVHLDPTERRALKDNASAPRPLRDVIVSLIHTNPALASELIPMFAQPTTGDRRFKPVTAMLQVSIPVACAPSEEDLARPEKQDAKARRHYQRHKAKILRRKNAAAKARRAAQRQKTLKEDRSRGWRSRQLQRARAARAARAAKVVTE